MERWQTRRWLDGSLFLLSFLLCRLQALLVVLLGKAHVPQKLRVHLQQKKQNKKLSEQAKQQEAQRSEGCTISLFVSYAKIPKQLLTNSDQLPADNPKYLQKILTGCRFYITLHPQLSKAAVWSPDKKLQLLNLYTTSTETIWSDHFQWRHSNLNEGCRGRIFSTLYENSCSFESWSDNFENADLAWIVLDKPEECGQPFT